MQAASPRQPDRQAAHDPVQLRRAVTSSFIGSVIEYYDFLLYATAAAVVFAEVFFSNLSPLAATLASFSTFATGYLARPLGGILFGHFGDRIGRKRMLVLTMSLMGVASFLIGVLPTYEQAGTLAPVALVLLRIVQGVAVGGEWGGAVLMSAEHATGRRGLWASFTNAGAPFGMALSTVALSGTAAVVGEDAFVSWGWRIPFLLSLALLAVGLFIRLRVAETPVFAEEERRLRRAPRRSLPLWDVVRHHPRVLLLGIGVGLSAFVVQGMLTTYLIAYAVNGGYERQTVLHSLALSSTLAVAGIVGWSALSDRLGRRPVVTAGALAVAAYSFVLFPMVDSGSTGMLVLALVVGQSLLHPLMYGPLAALYTELFATRNRYTGASLGYQIAGLGAGFAPLIFTKVQAETGDDATLIIPVIVAAFCLATVVCIAVLGETSRTDLAGPAPDGAVPDGAAKTATGDPAKTAPLG
ncbi:MFS transporter [Streptomyces sp. TRM 70361]|uniref:MFS transporter n=1 Tax=Streptomyces sp. TRM 70361 TaxID=3116553 RepID=UPI002E7AC68D|nr:MFS transporter [Streptomyces sp. TRM 70361]MEE1940968.1 MFS transporter [Streptomyces sp. TRM 70361]